MADPREFVLIGSFKDGITPELQKINNELAKLKASFAGIGSRKNTGFRGATQEIGKLVSAHKKLSESIKGVEGDLRSTVGVLQQYRREMGKAAAATRAFQKAGGSLGSRQFSQNMDSANKSAQAYLRTLKQINSESRRMPRGGMGGGFQPPRPPRGGSYGGGGGGGVTPPTPPRTGTGGGMGAHMGEFGFAYTLGSNIAQPIQNAIVAGFQIGVSLMTQPFQYFANAFGERVQDQISDLKAAGGLLSISKRSDTPFLKTIDEAIQYQQDTNQVFAKMAAALPGVTNDYVQVGKRLSDTMGRIASGDFQNALQEANRIRATEEGRKFYGGAIAGTGPEATKEVITTLLGEMTKKTTIAGLGGRSGAGGIAGAYGLPGLTERMLSQQEVSMGQFQRYAAVFSDPTIQDALSRNVDLINKTLPNTTARFKAMQKLLDEVVTPDLIEKLRTSVDGIYQGFRSAVLDPDTGLFGLGRQFKDFGYKINQYGQYVLDKEGKKIKDSLSIFEIVADIFSNAGQAILPLVEALPLVFDPLKKVASILMDARHYAAEFNRTFNMYREGLKKLSEVKGNEFLKDSLDVRASLSAVSNLLYQFGVIGKGDFESIGKQLLSKELNIGEMMKKLLDSILNSDIAGEIGETVGEIIGTVLSEVSKVTGFLSGRIASSSKLFAGLKKGFDAAGGTEAFKNIFKDVFMSLFNVLKEVLKILPLEAYFMAALAVVAPAAVQGLAMAFASRIWSGMQAVMNVASRGMVDQLKKQAARFTRVQPTKVTDLGSVVTDPSRMLPAAKETALATTTKAGPLAKGMGAFGQFFVSFGNYIKGVGPRFMGFFKGLLGKLTIFGGAITSIISLFQGKDLATALAEGAGPILGAALGAALIPFLGPIGPMIGSLIGGWIGSMKAVTEPLAAAISSVFGTLKTTFDLLIQIGSDIGGVLNGLAQKLFGVSKEFDVLRFAMEALLSPFRLLELMVLGLYEGYLRVKEQFFGLDDQEKRAKNETFLLRMQKTAEAELAFKQAYNQKARAEYQKELDNLRAQGKGDEERARIVSKALGIIDAKLKQKDPNYKPPITTTTKPTTTTAPKPTPAKPTGADPVQANLRARALQDLQWLWKKLTTTPAPPPQAQKPPTTPAAAAAAKAPQEVIATAQNTSSLNTKATTQITQGAAIQKATAETKAIAQTSNTTLGNIKAGLIAVSNKIGSLQTAILGDLNNIQAGVSRISSLLQSGNLKVKSDFNMPGGLPGGGSGGPAIFGAAAQKFGLQMTSGYRPGDPGYHGINRARDYSNGSGPTPQMMAFAQYLYSTFGSNLKELIYTPLGFSIKNGQKVPPYAQAAHYNHVHVAWALGPQNPVGFGSLGAAQAWENSMIPGSAKVASVTANSTEGFGSTSVGDIYVTVNAGATNDPDQLAYMVAERIQAAVGDAVNSNILV